MATVNYLQFRGFETDPKTGLPVNVDRDAAFKNIRDELQNQYDNLVSYDSKLAYRGRFSDLPKIFDQQANQLANAGVVSVTSLRNVDNKLVDTAQDGKVINTTNLRGQIATDRDTGAVKWGDIFSGVKGGANYGISFDPSGSPIFYPVYEKSKSPIAQIGLGGLESIIVPLLTIGGAFIGVPGLGAIGGAAAGAAAGNTTGQLLASGKVDWEQVAISAAGAAAGQAAFGGAGAEAQPTSVGGTPGVSEVYAVAPPGGTSAPLPPQAAGFGSADYNLLGTSQFGGVGETGLLQGSTEGLRLPTTPEIAGMGGGQGLTVPVAGGTITGAGFIPVGSTPALGDPSSFINDPNVLGQPVFPAGGSTLSLTDALRGMNLANQLMAGGQQAMGMPQQQAPFQPAGVDYSGILGLLGQRPSVPGIQGLLGPAQIRYPNSLLG